MYNDYRGALIAKGASIAEADRQMDIIERLMRERPDAYRAVFNNIYKTDNPVFSTQPNALLIATIEGRTPGRALDIGIGQGRNSVFLALKGWDVTGFDASDEGIAVAQRNAARAGVKIKALRESEATFDYGSGQWDLIVFTYEPFPITSAAYVGRLGNSLKSAGSSSSKASRRKRRAPIGRQSRSTPLVYWQRSTHNNFASCGSRTRWRSPIGMPDKNVSCAWLQKSDNRLPESSASSLAGILAAPRRFRSRQKLRASTPAFPHVRKQCRRTFSRPTKTAAIRCAALAITCGPEVLRWHPRRVAPICCLVSCR